MNPRVVNGILYRLRMRFRHKRFLRILASPFRKWKTSHLYGDYLRSEDYRSLEKLKNLHKGERCFIIGNGPSLRPEDLDKLKGEYTFAANRIYEIFDRTEWRPSVYLAYDDYFLREKYQDISQIPCELKLLPFRWHQENKKQKLGEDTVLVWIGTKKYEVDIPAPWEERMAYIPEDISLGFSDGRTVTFLAIQMALYMGFHEIYLIGVDFSYSRVLDEKGVIQHMDGVEDYFNQKRHDTSILYYTPTKYAYEVAREYCDAHGIIIKNATRGGKLKVFERVNFDDLF